MAVGVVVAVVVGVGVGVVVAVVVVVGVVVAVAVVVGVVVAVVVVVGVGVGVVLTMARPNPTEDELKTMIGRGASKEHGVVKDHDAKAGSSGKAERGTTSAMPVSNPAPSPTNKNAKYAPYKNKLEHSYAQKLALDKQAGTIKDWGYETQSLKLAAGKYHRPDFTVWHLDGTVEQAQTKGYHKNLRASMTGLIWAAQRHPWFRFTVHRYKNGWISEEVQP